MAVQAFHFVQILYWLALSTWFGGVLFVILSAQVIFRTVRESDPVLPTVLSVNLEGQHATLLAGSIVADLLAMLLRVQTGCAAVLVLALAGQWFLIDLNTHLVTSVLRTALFVAAVGLVAYDWRVVSPRLARSRRTYIDHADEPDVANPAKDEFDRYGRETLTVLTVLLFVLLGMVLFSAGLSPSHMRFAW